MSQAVPTSLVQSPLTQAFFNQAKPILDDLSRTLENGEKHDLVSRLATLSALPDIKPTNQILKDFQQLKADFIAKAINLLIVPTQETPCGEGFQIADLMIDKDELNLAIRVLGKTSTEPSIKNRMIQFLQEYLRDDDAPILPSADPLELQKYCNASSLVKLTIKYLNDLEEIVSKDRSLRS